jgi:hypothetical protein
MTLTSSYLGKKLVFGYFKSGDNLFAGNRREIIEKQINRVTRLNVVDQVFKRYPGAGKNRGPPEDFRIDNDGLSVFRLHGVIMHPSWAKFN